jgi:nicotinamidase/pyrazinamidase
MPYGQQTLSPDHCRQGTEGAAFHPKLEIDRAELIIRKGFRSEIDSYSAYFENDRRTPTVWRVTCVTAVYAEFSWPG